MRMLQGTAGNDTLIGYYDTADTLDGGAGRDTLEGGRHGDTYVYDRGYGWDVIYDDYASSSYTDVIEFGPGLAPADLILTRQGDDLVIEVEGTNDRLLIEDQFNLAGRIEEFHFDGGTTWSYSDVEVMLLQGTPGIDDLVGFDGDDLLDGSAGDDSLEGGRGDDTYVFDRGYGADVVYDAYTSSSYTDVVDFGPGLAPADLAVVRVGDDLVLSVIDTGDVLTIREQFDSSGRIEEFRFDGGTTWTNADVLAFTAQGTSGDDTLAGSAAGDSLDGGGGDDLVTGGGGSDVLAGGDGADTLDGGAGDDLLTGGDGIDTFVLTAGTGSDAVLDFTAGRRRPPRPHRLRLGRPRRGAQCHRSGRRRRDHPSRRRHRDPRRHRPGVPPRGQLPPGVTRVASRDDPARASAPRKEMQPLPVEWLHRFGKC